MSLTDTQIWELAKRMDIPLVFCDFKDNLQTEKLQYNKSYIINMEDEYDAKGMLNDGSHYTCFQVNKYPNGKIEKVYFDSFGVPPPIVVEKFMGGGKIPYNKKDVQSLMNEACGYYCLAFLYWINSYYNRTGDLATDCIDFIDLFDDLNESVEWKKNEYILKHFFRSVDPALRKPISVEEIKHISDKE